MKLHAGFWLITLCFGAYWGLALFARDRAALALAIGAVAALALTPQVRRKWAVLAALAGIAMDAFWCYSGVLQFSGSTGVPVWMMALWLAFGCWWCWLMQLIRASAWPTALFGAVAGPLSYLLSWKLKAFTPLIAPDLLLLALSVGWAVYLPAVSWALTRRRNAA
ncbi:Protein of uncharacterised function (DUF2878) [Serratia rubidaea]|nr:Protein of uncharacterised function (DUF2878) [Serratia rubidaea]